MPELQEVLAGPVAEVAPRLLGATLRTSTPAGVVAVRLVEVEAYAGPDDPASHAHRGRTPRTATMFGPPGRLYVYLSHGLHHCLNVVTGPEDTAAAVLLRAGVVSEGLDLVRLRRPGVGDRDLVRGPGRLGRALGVDLSWDGVELLGPGPAQLVLADRAVAPVACGPRVGVSRAADVLWRWWVPGEPAVSPYRRAAKAERAPDVSPGEG